MCACWRAPEGAGGKIEKLRAEARREPGQAAACLLAALGRDEIENENEETRAYVGALLLLDGLDELKTLRKMVYEALKSE